MTVSIGDKLIGRVHKPFVIAEMSGNHNQSIDNAFKIIDQAVLSGVDAIKLQTYTADTMTLREKAGSFTISDPNSLWYGDSLHDLYKKAYTPWEWHEPLMKYARERGIICFSSPFDETAVDFLERLDVPVYKIASFENNHLPLIRKVSETGKPLIISTGMASLSELEMAVSTAKGAGCRDIILLKCTSTYPATPQNSNLATIPHMKQVFGVEVGLSDHTLGHGVAVAAVSLGATVIEKHFTLSRADGGVDSAFSLEPEEMRMLVDEVQRGWESIGSIHYGPTKEEEKSLVFRRSIYVSDNIAAGELLTPDNIRIVRPGDGESPSMYSRLLGRKAPRELKAGTPLRLDDLLG